MKIKLFVACGIKYFELGIFCFNSYVYYLTRGFIASTSAFNLLACAFTLPTRAFNLATRAFSVITRESERVTRGFELVTREFELVTRGSLFHVFNISQPLYILILYIFFWTGCGTQSSFCCLIMVIMASFAVLVKWVIKSRIF